MMTILIVILAILLILCAVLLIYTRNFVEKFMTRDDHLSTDVETAPANFSGYVLQYKEAMKEVSKLNFEPLSITSNDGLKLAGKLFRLKPDNNRVVVGFHGYHGSDYYDMARFFDLYRRLGYDILIISERAHHDSEGHYITFGAHEQEDGILWLNQIVSLYGDQVQIVIHGVSMGAATVDLLSGRADLPSQVKCVVSDCAYTSIEQEARNVVHAPHWVQDILLFFLNFWIKRLANFDLREASPIDSVVHARVPMPFIHGEADNFVPYDMAKPLYEKCPTEKELFTVPGAAHAASYVIDPKGYEEHFEKFTEKYVH